MNTEKIPILYEDKDLLVAIKPVGYLSEASDVAPSLPTALATHAGGRPLSPVTRLDCGVGGVMVLGKSAKSMSYLSAEFSDHENTVKEYLAVVAGKMEEREGELTDLLFKDSAKNKSYVVRRMRRGVKEARLAYRVLGEREAEGKCYSLLHVRLYTGRTHQIRVQLSSRRHPLVGDGKYGGESGYGIALLSYAVTFTLPTGARRRFCASLPDVPPFSYFVDFTQEISNFS